MAEHLWVHYARPRSQWYRTPAHERDLLQSAWDEVAAGSRAKGANLVGRWSVRGQSDYSTAEVWTFTDTDAVLAHWDGLVAAGYPEWFATANTLGSPLLPSATNSWRATPGTVTAPTPAVAATIGNIPRAAD